jgi:enamine deaminase RidA (YjgF/YER057c/UK114 family)
MTTTTALPMNVLPAPRSNRQGDYIWTSTIYPIDTDGSVVHADALSPHVGESEMAAQTRAVCEGLKGTLAEAGTSMDRVLKAEVYLVDPAEFYEFKLVWREYFPSAPPARTTAVVMDEHIIAGARLSLSAVALAGDSAVQKEIIHVDDVPDPMEAEWVPQATRGGIFVFPSALPATDFETGIAVKTNPIAPYYGSNAELQTRYIFENWGKVLVAAGSGLEQGLKSQGMEVSLRTFHDMDALWGEYLGRGAGTPPPGRSSMAMRGLLVPDALLVVNCFFLAPDSEHQKVESRKGIRWHPEDVRNVHFSPGLWAGDWFFMAGQGAIPDYENMVFETAPPGLPHYFSDIEIQTESTMNLIREQMEGNDLSLTNVVDARVYLVNAQRDYRGFARAWRRIWEPLGRMPSMNLIPSRQYDGRGGMMMDDLIVEIDLIAHREQAS